MPVYRVPSWPRAFVVSRACDAWASDLGTADAGTGTEVARTLDAIDTACPARSRHGGHVDWRWTAPG